MKNPFFHSFSNQQLRKVALTSPAFLLLMLSSCSKEVVEPTSYSSKTFTPSTVSLVNGRVYFANAEIFSKEEAKLSKLTKTEDLDEWEKSLNFKSLRTQALLNPESESALLLSSFHFPFSYASLINNSGEYQIGNKIYWFHDGYKYETSSEEELQNVKKNPSSSQNRTIAGGKIITPKRVVSSMPSTLGNTDTQRVQDSGDGKDKKYSYSFQIGSGRRDQTVVSITYATYIYTEQSPFYFQTFDSKLFLEMNVTMGLNNTSNSRIINYSLDLVAKAGYEHSAFYDDHIVDVNNHVEQSSLTTNTVQQVTLGEALCYFNNNGFRDYSANGVKWDYQLYGYINTTIIDVTPNQTYNVASNGTSLW